MKSTASKARGAASTPIVFRSVSSSVSAFASSDGGQSWQQRDSLDAAPRALTATNADEILAAVEGAILTSSDGDRRFTVRYDE